MNAEQYRELITHAVENIYDTEALKKIYTLADLQYEHLSKEGTAHEE